MEKIAIIDVDGTLLNWRNHFETWAQHHNLIKQPDPLKHTFEAIPANLSIKTIIDIFNETIHISRLPPEVGAIKGVTKLHENGYTLKICTSFSAKYDSMKLREKNLTDVFGKIFAEYHFVPFTDFKDGDGKMDFIRKNLPGKNDVILIEDNPFVVRSAIENGLSPSDCFLIERSFNTQDARELFEQGVNVGDWKDIIKTLFGE